MSAGTSGSASSTRIALPVATSVMMTVRMTPSLSASAPQRNLPTAPPAKTSISARPIACTVEPLAIRRKGRKVRKPLRVELSMTWMAASAWKPRASRMPQSVEERDVSLRATISTPARRRKSTRRMTTAAARPTAAYVSTAPRHPIHGTASATAAGTTTLPRSPEKLYVPSAMRRRPDS